jgi:ketosteroid isomerase-like protein
MSQENVEIVRRVYEEWGKGNFRAGESLWDPRVVFIPTPELPESGDYQGPKGIIEFMTGFLESWTEYTIAGEKFTEVGDSVVVETRQHGVGRGSGIAGGGRQTHVWTFRGRAVIRFEAFATHAEALEAVGLREGDPKPAR